MLRPRILPNAHEHTRAVLLIGIEQLGQRFAQAKDLGVLVSLKIDCDVDVLVALALKLEFAEISLLGSRILGPLPLDLREVVGL